MSLERVGPSQYSCGVDDAKVVAQRELEPVIIIHFVLASGVTNRTVYHCE